MKGGDVAPYMGAWIETQIYAAVNGTVDVAPYMGAWIETPMASHTKPKARSLPTWGRGLKRVGVDRLPDAVRRSLHGGVD